MAKNTKVKLGDKELSKESQIALKDVLLCISKYENQLEVLRLFLCTNVNFEPYASFQRLDRDEDGFIRPTDFMNFMRENGYMHTTEANFYFIVKFFDSDEDGKLTYPEYLQMVLPCTNHKLRSATTQRPMEMCKPGDYLSIDVEQDLARLFKMEVEMHKESEYLKQILESLHDYNQDLGYKCIDNQNIMYVDFKCLENFFKRLKHKGITDDDITSIIRRLDLDSDGRLKKEELIQGIQAQEPFSKMLVRIRQKQKADFMRMKDDEGKQKLKVDVSKNQPNLEAIKSHVQIQSTFVNPRKGFDRDYEKSSGVSPIKFRHEIDLYGCKSGVGQFNPIMVENINRLPDLHEYQEKELINKLNKSQPKNQTKLTQKTATPQKSDKKEIKQNIPQQKKVNNKPDSSKKKVQKDKLVLTNQNPRKNYENVSPLMPGTFESKYSQHNIEQSYKKNFNRDLINDFEKDRISSQYNNGRYFDDGLPQRQSQTFDLYNNQSQHSRYQEMDSELDYYQKNNPNKFLYQ